MNTLLKELRDKIWELKENSNVTTKEEFQYAAFNEDMQKVKKMVEIEQMARVPTKMKEELVPMKKKCACCSSFISFLLS